MRYLLILLCVTNRDVSLPTIVPAILRRHEGIQVGVTGGPRRPDHPPRRAEAARRPTSGRTVGDREDVASCADDTGELPNALSVPTPRRFGHPVLHEANCSRSDNAKRVRTVAPRALCRRVGGSRCHGWCSRRWPTGARWRRLRLDYRAIPMGARVGLGKRVFSKAARARPRRPAARPSE